MVKITANSIRIGNIIVYNKTLYKVLNKSHTQPGKGGAYVQLEMRTIDKDKNIKLNERFRSTEYIEKAHIDSKPYQYLYSDDQYITLMDLETFDQEQFPADLLGDSTVYLQDEMALTVESYAGTPVSIILPETVILKVIETETVVKGQTAASSNKPAILENDLRVMVPPFIDVGDKIIVNTMDATYVERAKNN
ncbi:MAG: elongation factor P [Pseudomonadota bacterium]